MSSPVIRTFSCCWDGLSYVPYAWVLLDGPLADYDIAAVVLSINGRVY